MGDNVKFSATYDSQNKVLTGKVLSENINKDDAKEIYSISGNALQENSDYSDYILDASEIKDISIDSFGYLFRDSIRLTHSSER